MNKAKRKRTPKAPQTEPTDSEISTPERLAVACLQLARERARQVKPDSEIWR
jgi:hypothetical protein